MAVNCSVRPGPIDGAGFGVTEIDCKTGAVIDSVIPGDVTPLEAAVIVLLPAAIPVARPTELMVAKVVLLEFQVAVLVRFAVLPSE